jgi:hypothetical protein
VVCIDLVKNMRHRILSQRLIDKGRLDRVVHDARRHLDHPATLSGPVTYFLGWAREPERQARHGMA